MVMEKSKLEKFISKYNIGGACESVKLVSDGTQMSVRSISDDKNVLAEVVGSSMNFPEGEFSIYETKKLRSLLSVLGETLKVAGNTSNGKVTGLNMSDSDTKTTFVLADESVIPKVPDLKKLPPMDVEIVLDEKFVTTFAKAKGALSEVDTFTVTSDGTDASVVIGYSSLNTNRINIKTTTKSNAKIDPISFSANYFKEILLSNKEIKDGVLKVSSKGIAVAEFDGGGFTSKYFLVQIDTKD
jgi:hypothetical protein